MAYITNNKNSKSGNTLVLENSIKAPLSLKLKPNELSQDETPSPDYPQEIHTISGDNEIVVGNKNLWNKDDESAVIGYYNMDGSFYPSINYRALSFNCNEGEKFVKSGDGWGGIVTFWNDDTFVSSVNATNVTIPSGVNNVRFACLYSSTNAQLEKNTTATDYVKHQEQSLPLNLGDLEYCKIGDYEDEFVYNTTDTTLELNKWYLKKKIGKYTFTGNEGITGSNTDGGTSGVSGRFYINCGFTNFIGTDAYLKSNRFISGTTYGNDNTVIQIVNSGQVYLRINFNDYDINTSAKLQTFLQNNKTNLYYPLLTPTYTLLNDTLQTQLNNIQKALSYQDKTSISQVNNDLPFNINAEYYINESEYNKVIYSQDDDNDIKIWFNNVELENAGYLTEKLEGSFRLLANDGKKRFSLDNFVAKELTLTIHDINLNAIQDQVKISIGTLVNNEYQYIPIGVFNIQDIPTTNNGTTTIKLRDNRVKFEFEYNAKPLMDENEGKATYKQILDDICQKAGVVNKVATFDGDDIETSLVDSTIKGNIYVTFIAEQGGYVPILDREGALDFIDLNNAYVWRIPLSIVSNNYQLGTPYSVERVVYESGVIKYETSNDENLNTLYLDASNPYIINQEQIDNILTKFNNFQIDSVSFSEGILGNPAIDPYDIIEVYDDEDANETVIFRTLANQTYTFNGKHRQLFDTQIDKEARKENVTKSKEATFKRWAKTTIDEIDAKIEITAGEISNISSNIATLNVATDSISSEVASQTTTINELGQTISQINSVIQEQTDNAITTWFNQSGIQGTLDQLQQAIDSNDEDIETIKSYYKVALDDDQSSSHYGETYVELGADNNQTKIRIYPDIIEFLTNGEETAYISNNSLYISEGTILTRQKIGHWVTVEDNSGNLNTSWED